MADNVIAGPADLAVLLIQAQDALKMHYIWMERGYRFLEGHALDLPAGFVRNDDLCPVGNWLRERLDSRFRELPLYAQTNRLHEEFHVVLDELFKENVKQIDQSRADRFHNVGDALTRSLEEWIALGRKANAS